MTVRSQFPILIEVNGCSLESPQDFIGLTYNIEVINIGERYLDFISSNITLYAKPTNELNEETDLSLQLGDVVWMNMKAHQIWLNGKRTDLNCSISKDDN